MNHATDATQIAREKISRKAYEIYEQRGMNGGRELDDWLEAERQFFAEVLTAWGVKPRTTRKKTSPSLNGRKKVSKS